MNYNFTSSIGKSAGAACAFILLLPYLFGCTQKLNSFIDRSVVPPVNKEVPAATSEIRALQHHSINREGEVLHLRGQLFTKRIINDSVQIKPCRQCILTMRTPNDRSLLVRLITRKDGFFTFNGTNQPYTISLQNEGLNDIDLGTLSFETGGVTTLRIINAAGSSAEQFTINHNGTEYRWQKVR